MLIKAKFSFLNISNIYNPLARLTKKKKEIAQISSISNKSGVITTDPTYFKRIKGLCQYNSQFRYNGQIP